MNALPVVWIAGRRWYVDERLGEIRAADAPWDALTLDEARLLLMLQSCTKSA